jgi:two-component system OmpR family sensor kinase
LPNSVEQLFIVVSEDQFEGADDGSNSQEPSAEMRRLRDFVAQELKAPVGSIAGLARYLHAHPTAKAEDRESAVDGIRLDADRAMLIIDSILSLIQSKRADWLSAVPVHSVIGRAVQVHRRRQPGRPIAVSGDSPVYGLANAACLELALNNLLDNADTHTPADGEIEVTIRQSGSRVSVRIMDRGTALRPDGDRKTSEVNSRSTDSDLLARGSAMSLVLSKELVESMQGEMWAGPRRNGGTVFTICLPSAPLRAPGFRSERFSSNTWEAGLRPVGPEALLPAASQSPGPAQTDVE